MTTKELEVIGAALRRVRAELDQIIVVGGSLGSVIDALRANVDNGLKLVADDFRQLEGVARDARRLAADDLRLLGGS